MNRFSKRAFELSLQKRALFEKVLRKEGMAVLPLSGIARRQDRASLPLSFAQQRLWFLDQWAPDRSIYSICRAFSLLDKLDLTALKHSICEIVRRHEALRTMFAQQEGQTLQNKKKERKRHNE